MRILFATAHPHLPQFTGGSQSSTHDLAQALAARGHGVAVLAALAPSGMVGLRARVLMKLLGRKVAADRSCGYPVYRKWVVWEDMAEVIAATRPDVAVVQAMNPVPVAAALCAQGVPTVIYLRDVETASLGGDPRTLDSGVRYVANSQFTAARYRNAFGLESVVIPPLLDAVRYRVDRTPTPTSASTSATITFINPHPQKGRDIAFAVARACPDVPFCVVEAWPLEGEHRAAVEALLKTAPNVSFRPRGTDMRPVYAAARAVLMPSQWEEAWGRVASEAQVSGIPVIASSCGGLPEAVGPGGILVPPDAPLEQWVAAVRALWADDALHDRLSAQALAHSRRPELDPNRQIGRLMGVLEEAVRHAPA